jgi:hypothetical protein
MTSQPLSPESAPDLPFALETHLERAIAADPAWRAGIAWGSPRPGHPEGQVLFHIRDLLANIDHFFASAADRPRLRLIALLHDTFKYQAAAAAHQLPRPTHGLIARAFAEQYIDDAGVLGVIELHDEAYKAWRLLDKRQDAQSANRRASALIARLGQHLDLFMCFYFCDQRTGDKSIAHYQWFESIVAAWRR